jgi:hypothetical protein
MALSARRPLIEIVVDEVVLHGFPAGRRDAIAHAVEQRLTELATSEEFRAHRERGGSIGRLDAGLLPTDGPRRSVPD